MPKNTSTKDYLLAGASFLGCALELLAAYKGPGFNGTVPAQWFINWVVIFNGLYGLGFLTVPETLMKMNFEGSFDKMHLFMGRMIGGLMLTLCCALIPMHQNPPAAHPVVRAPSLLLALLPLAQISFTLSSERPPSSSPPSLVLWSGYSARLPQPSTSRPSRPLTVTCQLISSSSLVASWRSSQCRNSSLRNS